MVTAVSVLTTRYSHVDPSRVAIIGWSHGGMISLLSVFRHPVTFKAARRDRAGGRSVSAARLEGHGQRRVIDPAEPISGGLPSEKPKSTRERSPVFLVDRLQIPLLVHLAANDTDVTMEEGLRLIDALRARRPILARTKMSRTPRGPTSTASSTRRHGNLRARRNGGLVEPRLVVFLGRTSSRRVTASAGAPPPKAR